MSSTLTLFAIGQQRPVKFNDDQHIVLARVAQTVAKQTALNGFMDLTATIIPEKPNTLCIQIFKCTAPESYQPFYQQDVLLPQANSSGELAMPSFDFPDDPCKNNKMGKLFSLVAFTVAYYLQEQANK